MERHISPRAPSNGRKVWTVCFKHPDYGKPVTASLSTHDETTAKALCRDLSRLCSGEFKTATEAVTAGILGRAIAIYFRSTSKEPLTTERLYALGALFQEDALAELQHKRALLLGDDSEGTPEAPEPSLDIVKQIWERTDARNFVTHAELVRIVSAADENRRIGELEEKLRTAEVKLKVLEPENDELRAENGRLRKSQNLDVKATIDEARDLWKERYPVKRAAVTVSQATTALDSFIASLPKQGKTLLRDVTTNHIDNWVLGLRKLDGSAPSPVTVKKNRAYVSSFWTIIRKPFNLSVNPMETADDAPGIGKALKATQNPDAIITMEHLHDLLDGFKKAKLPYWRCWVAVAVLGGPRWAEQIHLRLSDVNLDTKHDPYFRVLNMDEHGTKTGRERHVTIEQRVLLPILSDYLKTVRPKLGKSQWLFPSLVETRARKLTTDMDKWTYAPFGLAHRAARKKAQSKAKLKTADHWTYTQMEYRHSFGSLLYLCGWPSLQISRAMGHESSAMCEEKYCQRTRYKERLPLSFSEY